MHANKYGVDVASTTLYMKNISKSFGATRALRNVDLAIFPGEIHGLLGQNGCGKSTLIKILAGYHEPDRGGGQLWINGDQVELPIPPGGFKQHGISFVHQDLGLIPDLSVLDNWTVNKVALQRSFKLNWRKQRELAENTLHKYGLDIDTRIPVSRLGPVEKAMFAIVKAVVALNENAVVREKNRGLLILDEPTVFLPRAEIDQLFTLVRNIASEGLSVMFVTHDIDEVLELTDRYTVLRDGLNVGVGTTKTSNKDKIIEMILGKKLQKYQINREEKYDEKFAGQGKSCFTAIKGLIVDNIDFVVHSGEILGITGLVGSGFEELPYLLYGASQYQRGVIDLFGDKVNLSRYTPANAARDGISLIPADRAGAGGIGGLTVADNVNMQVLDRFNSWKLQRKGLRNNALKALHEYDVRPQNPELGFSQLSGGNQQKALLAKWLQDEPKLLILHEPTQGVDVGSRQQIYQHISRVAKEGAAVICCSSDYEELSQICDRVIVLGRGRISCELSGSLISKENIATMCYTSLEGHVN